MTKGNLEILWVLDRHTLQGGKSYFVNIELSVLTSEEIASEGTDLVDMHSIAIASIPDVTFGKVESPMVNFVVAAHI